MAEVFKTWLSAKLHNLRVTECNPMYVGSITLDPDWMNMVGILEHEQVHVWNVTNGNRIVTYAIPGDSKAVELNGSAACHFDPDDIIIVAAFEQRSFHRKPKILVFNETNDIEKDLR